MKKLNHLRLFENFNSKKIFESSLDPERLKFFTWLEKTDNLDLWEALLDQDNFPDEQETYISASNKKDELMTEYEEEMGIDRSWRKRIFGH